MSFDPTPPPRALDPMTGNPARTLVRNNNVVTRDPNVASSVPAPVAQIPVITGSGRSRSLNDHLWGCHADVNVGAEASRCSNGQSETGSRCRSSPSAPES